MTAPLDDIITTLGDLCDSLRQVNCAVCANNPDDRDIYLAQATNCRMRAEAMVKKLRGETPEPTDLFEVGQLAFARGKNPTDCPFKAGSPQYEKWMKGYFSKGYYNWVTADHKQPDFA